MVFVRTHTDIVDEFNGLVKRFPKREERWNDAANEIHSIEKKLYDWWMKKSNLDSKRIHPVRKLELPVSNSPSQARAIRLLHTAVGKNYGYRNGVLYHAHTTVIERQIRKMKILLQDDGGEE